MEKVRAFEEILNEYPSVDTIPYHVLLATKEWSDRRKTITKRDYGRCGICKKRETYAERIGPGEPIHYHIERMDLDKVEPDVYSPNFGWEFIRAEKPYHLHVHHTFYNLNYLPWAYPDDALVTLCNWCHWELHQNHKVPVYRSINNAIVEVNLTPCERCCGAGWLPEFKYYKNGICFRCNGALFEERIRR